MVRSPLAADRPAPPPTPVEPTSPPAPAGPGRAAFRPAGRSRARIASGIGLLAIAIVINLAVYRSVDDRRLVLQVVRDVPAGEQLTAADLRTVAVSADPTIPTIDGEAMRAVIGQYAKVRLAAGSLVVTETLQRAPLVGAGSSLVALTLASGELPLGLRERSHVSLVWPAADAPAAPATSGTAVTAGVMPILGSVDAYVVGLPTSLDGGAGEVSATFEVAARDAPVVAMADRVRVVLLEPGVDPASAPERPDAQLNAQGDGAEAGS